MTLQTLAQIILISFVTVFTIALVVLTYILGRISVRDNPDKAAIFIKTGHSISKPKKGNKQETTKKGTRYSYGNGKSVIIPASYQEDYYCNARMIFISRRGQLIASPFDKDIVISEAEKETLIEELFNSHFAADGMRALRGKTALNTIVVAIIAFLLGVGVMFGFSAIQKQQARATQPVQQEQQLETPVEVQ